MLPLIEGTCKERELLDDVLLLVVTAIDDLRVSMKPFRIYQADAFASELFKGNPAAVVPLEKWLSDDLLQKIAIENNLSETAFYVSNGSGFDLRWFTPGFEVDLCGHATLATAHILFEQEGFPGDEVRFHTRVGELIVRKSEDGYVMDFPIDELKPLPIPDYLPQALATEVHEVYEGREDLLAIVSDQRTVETLDPDQHLLSKPDARGVIVSAAGDEVDFVSRCFFPKAGIPEDPVTGSAHTTMAAYWSPKLGKTKLKAKQLSARGGDVGVEVLGDRVLLTGTAKTFMKGEIYLPHANQ